MSFPPTTITIKSDMNELTLKDTIKQKDGLKFQYIYTKSISKKGLTVEFDENQLQKIISTNQIKQ